MKNEISFQQVRAPIAVALTVILNSMFALPSDARLTDPPKVESPLLLAAILFVFPLVIWNHPPSLTASGATLLILSVLKDSDGGTLAYFEDAARPLWFTAGLLLGAALAFVARKHVRSTLSQVSGWRYILHPARLAEALIGIGAILVLFSPPTTILVQADNTDAPTIQRTLLFWFAAGLFITLLAAVSPTATIICLAAVVWFHGINEHSAFPTTGTVSILFVLVLVSVSPLFVLHDLPAQETENSDASTGDVGVDGPGRAEMPHR